MKKLLFIILAFGSHLLSFAQPGTLDLSFDPGAGPNAQILSTAIQSDGKIIIGGMFGIYNGTYTTCLARLNTNGSLDTTFHVGLHTELTPWVQAIVIQPDGKIIIGGTFNFYDSVPAHSIVRLSAGGALDTSFHTGTGFNERVFALSIQPDGKILVGGLFTNYNGTVCKRLARLNVDGSYDMSFNTTHGANGSVEAIALQPDGKIMIGGDFTSYDTVQLIYDTICFRVARVNADGSRDVTFIPAIGADAVVHDLAIQPDRQIIIVGNFSAYNFQPRGKITRLEADAAMDTRFNNSGAGVNSQVYDVEWMSNGKILVAGDFTAHNGTAINRIAMLESWGVLDSTFKPGTGADQNIYSVSIQSNRKIIIAGAFNKYNGTVRNRIARLYNCTTPQPAAISGNDSTLCPGEVFIYSVPPVAESYEWTLPAGWTGSSDSASIVATSNGQGGMISVRAFSDSCGYSAPQTKTIYRIEPPADPICLVTVDEQSTHNILIWEKIRTNLIDSFFIYRETTTSVYTKIASVPYDSLSEYHDTTANPNTTSYRYKLSSLDICGVETGKSHFHNTIHLQNLGTGNFQWTFYQIENALNPVLSFNVYRDAFGNGNFSQIGNIPGTNSTFTDNSYASFPNSEYVVDANWGISCTPQRGTINTTRSNIRKINVIDIPVDTHHVSINTLLAEDFKIYPNPAENTIILNFSSSANINGMKLFNSLGQIVWSEKPERTNGKAIKTIPVGELLKGVYVLAIETNTGSVKRKVIVQ